MIRPGRRALAALLLVFAMQPTIADAQDQCRTIRALTNVDGRRFADLTFRAGRDPLRLVVAAGNGAPLPVPRDCDFSIAADAADISCTWVPGDYAASVQLFDGLLARFRQCLGDGIVPPTGPAPYGNATALRDSTTELATAGGETRLSLVLIESSATAQLAAYHYVSLNVGYQVADPADGE